VVYLRPLGPVTVVVRGGGWTRASIEAALRAQESAMSVIVDMSVLLPPVFAIDLGDPEQTGGKHWLTHGPDGKRKVTRPPPKTT
jgi:hypothetical protein